MIYSSDSSNFISTSELKFTIFLSLHTVLQLSWRVDFSFEYPLFSMIISYKHFFFLPGTVFQVVTNDPEVQEKE